MKNKEQGQKAELLNKKSELSFQDLQFEDKEDKIRVHFLKIFYFDLEKKQLEKIASFTIAKNSIFFDEKVAIARRKFNNLLDYGFTHLKNKMTHKNAFYIHKNSGIPLMGTNYFGLVDRGTNLIEIKPLTSCNLNCIYCSVDEGPFSRRKTDYVIEKDYLVQEFKKLIAFKKVDHIDAHINAQGEPTLYADMVELVRDIAKIPQVKMISIDTNGTLLTEEYVDKLAQAGLKRFNLSLNALDPKIADKMAGYPYNLQKVKKLAAYIAKNTKADVIIVPVYLPGINDEELPKLAKFAKEIGAGKYGPSIGIQNFLPYNMGRNPVKPASFDVFYGKLKKIEQEDEVELICTKGDFKIKACKEYPKPFKKGQTVEAKLVMPGRFPREMLAVAKDRLISVINCPKAEGKVRVNIKRTKHNVFIGEFVG